MKPLLILGLDGVAFEAAGDGVAARMPFLARLIAEGNPCSVETVLPNNSMACWTSWFCGCSPSRHGIPDFVTFDSASTHYRLTKSTDRGTSALWENAAGQGRRSVVFNVPGTYPATPLNGIMIAGAPALSRDGLCFPADPPPAIKEKMRRYRSDLDFEVPRDSRPEERLRALRDIVSMIEDQIEMIRLLLRERWDLFIGVVTMTDRMQHFFLDEIRKSDPDDSEIGGLIRSAFARLDDFLEKLIDEWNGKARVVLVSDHGFVPCKYRFHLADWLESRGLFFRADRSVRPADPEQIDFLKADLSRSIFLPAPASSLGVRVNPLSAFSDADRQGALDSLIKGFAEVRDPDGLPVFERVLSRGEIENGPFASRLPDIMIVPRKGAIALTSQKGQGLFSEPERPGAHSLRSYFLEVGKTGEGEGSISSLTEMLQESGS